MPRPRRLNLPGIPQHVTQRGNNRSNCFFHHQDYVVYLKHLRKAAQKRECEIHAYVLMSNHVHLLATPMSGDGISWLMQDTGREYVRYVNSKYERTGTLWEGRFRSSLVDSEAYCLTCYRYIELNPVRAGMVSTPGEYPWSSYFGNALGKTDKLLTPHQTWLGLGDHPSDRRKAYRELFNCVLAQSDLEAIRFGNRKGLPLGTEAFKAFIESKYQIKLGTGKVGRPFNKK